MEGTSNQKPLNLCRVFSETARVIKSHRRTFLALACFFLFPSSLVAALYSLTVKSPAQDTTPVRTILLVVYYLFALGFSPLAVGSITYTVLHGFNGEPVKRKEAIKSITASYFPLLATSLAIQFITLIVVFGFALFVTVCAITTGLLGGVVASPYLVGLAVAVFVCVMLYLQVNWMLSGPVVVAESTRGFAALKRSKALMKGKRGLGLCLGLILGLIYMLVSWNTHFITEYAAGWGGASRLSGATEWRRFFFLALEFFITVFSSMVFQLCNSITTAVLYVNRKAVEKDDGKKSDECVSLLGDNDKVAAIV